MKLDQIQSLIALGIGVITFLGGALAWYAGAVEKRYAAQRDFQHLRRNQEQINNGINTILKDQDRRFDTIEKELSESKMLIHNLAGNLSSETISNILKKRRED